MRWTAAHGEVRSADVNWWNLNGLLCAEENSNRRNELAESVAVFESHLKGKLKQLKWIESRRSNKRQSEMLSRSDARAETGMGDKTKFPTWRIMCYYYYIYFLCWRKEKKYIIKSPKSRLVCRVVILFDIFFIFFHFCIIFNYSFIYST